MRSIRGEYNERHLNLKVSKIINHGSLKDAETYTEENSHKKYELLPGKYLINEIMVESESTIKIRIYNGK